MQDKHGADIAHTLYVSYIRSVRGKSLKNAVEAFVKWLILLEYFELAQSSHQVHGDQVDSIVLFRLLVELVRFIQQMLEVTRSQE